MATYNQIGNVNLAKALCLSKLPDKAREKVKSTKGTTTTDNTI